MTAEEPLGQPSEKGYLGIFTLKIGILSVFIFIFRRWSEAIGLKPMNCIFWIFQTTFTLKLSFLGPKN